MKTKEIEFKTMLSPADFTKLSKHYHLTKNDFKKQSNCYFDTADHQLKQLGWGLRIRLYPEKGEVTLKVPTTEGAGLWEITDELSFSVAQKYYQAGLLPTSGQVANYLQKHKIQPAEVKKIGELTTFRKEILLTDGLLALDESFYGKKHDYELELEVPEHSAGKKAFFALLHQFQLPFIPAENKITRAIKDF